MVKNTRLDIGIKSSPKYDILETGYCIRCLKRKTADIPVKLFESLHRLDGDKIIISQGEDEQKLIIGQFPRSLNVRLLPESLELENRGYIIWENPCSIQGDVFPMINSRYAFRNLSDLVEREAVMQTILRSHQTVLQMLGATNLELAEYKNDYNFSTRLYLADKSRDADVISHKGVDKLSSFEETLIKLFEKYDQK